MTTEVLGSTTAKPEPPASWIPDDNVFGARLALIRQRMGWGNVKEAAEACGIPVQSWRAWERDSVEPRGKDRIAKQIAAVTGCDEVWLIGGSDLIRLARGGDTHNIRSGRATNRPPDNRPTGRVKTKTPNVASAERPASRRPQRLGSITRPMSRRAA